MIHDVQILRNNFSLLFCGISNKETSIIAKQFQIPFFLCLLNKIWICFNQVTHRLGIMRIWSEFEIDYIWIFLPGLSLYLDSSSVKTYIHIIITKCIHDQVNAKHLCICVWVYSSKMYVAHLGLDKVMWNRLSDTQRLIPGNREKYLHCSDI